MQEHQQDRYPPAHRGIEVAFLIAIFAFLSLFHEIYVDDAFITLAYARTFAESGVWGMHAPFVSNAATSPLNVILLSGLIKLGLPGVWAAYALECFLATAIFFALNFISLRVFGSRLWAYVATLALFTNPLLVSTSGLETYLFIAVLLGCCVAYALERYLLLGLAAGLLVLARPDGVLLLMPLLILMIWEGKRALDFGKVITGFAIIVGAWGFVSWLYLGSAIPDTYFIKRKEAGWHGFSFVNGLALYDFKYPLATLLSVALVVFVPFALVKAHANRQWRAVIVLIGGLALIHYIAYSLLNLPPYHWYYGIFIGAVVLLGSAGLILLRDRFPSPVVFGFAAAIVFGGAITCAAAPDRGEMPIHSNLGTVAQYRAIADWLNDHTSIDEYQMVGELGVIQYYGRADAVNNFSDRAILRDFVNRLPDGSMRRWIADVNFVHLVPRAPVRSGYLLEENCVDSTGAVKTWTTSSAWIKSIVWCLKRK